MGTSSGAFSGSPFVGRADEVRFLVSEAQIPRAQCVLILGPAGIGKSRLAEEVARRVEGSHLYSLEHLARLRGRLIDANRRPMSFSGSVRDSGLPFYANVAAHIGSTPVDAPLIVLDDVDTVTLDDPISVKRALSSRPRTTVLMTARSENLDQSWESALFTPPHHVGRMALRGLGVPESLELVNALLGADESSELPVAAIGNPQSILEWIETRDDSVGLLGAGKSVNTLLGPDGTPLSPGEPGYLSVVTSVTDINDALISALAKRPHLMHELSPRKFEELVAELYAKSGFDVEVTRASKDGGIDIYAWQRAPFGSFLTIIDCKKHRADRPVQLGLIKTLYGTVAATEASVGVMATTSYFTKGAKNFQEPRQHRLGLQDFVSLKEMLERMHDKRWSSDPQDD